jgi:hypothetical protein
LGSRRPTAVLLGHMSSRGAPLTAARPHSASPELSVKVNITQSLISNLYKWVTESSLKRISLLSGRGTLGLVVGT